jgi:hypothetical protein
MTSARMLRGIVGGALTLTLGLAAISAPAAWAKPAKHPVTYKFTASKLAWTGSGTVIAATDAHGDLYYFSQSSGSTTWHEQVVAKARNGLSFSKPAIAWTGSSVFIAAVNQHGDLVYFVHTDGTWRYHLVPQADVDGLPPWQAPSVASVPGGGVLLSDGNDRGAAGLLAAWVVSPSGINWTARPVDFGNFGASSASAYSEESSGPVGQIMATVGGTIYFCQRAIYSSVGWYCETIGSVGSFGSGAVTATDSDIVVTAPVTTGGLDSWYEPVGGSVWTEQTVSSHPAADPAIAWFEQLGLHYHVNTYDLIAASGRGGQLDFWWQVDSGNWDPETIARASKQAAYGSPSMTVTGASVIVTATNTKNGSLVFWSQAFGATPWRMELVAKG